MLKQPLEDTRYYLICLKDGALDYASNVAYILSASKTDNKCKAQVIFAASKLMSEAITHEVSILKNETYALFQGSILRQKIAHIMQKVDVPIHHAILFSDAISTLLSLRRHLKIFRHPERGWPLQIPTCFKLHNSSALKNRHQ